MATQPPLTIQCSRYFLSWLHQEQISLAFTTYQTNRLFLIGLREDGRLSAFERHFERPMGLCATEHRLYMNSLWQIWELHNALPDGQMYQGYDRVYVPRRAHTTGHLDVHDIALDREGRIVFVNTLYSCLATISDRYSFRPLWKPPFISKLVPEDRCHLNGLAMADGKPAYVTTVSRSDVVAGWRDRRHTGGTVIDVEDDEIVLDTLSMPHSPRVYRDRLWLLNSGVGELGWVDRAAGRFEPVAFCPGYLRGLAFHRDWAVVGLSKPRHERTFSGLELDERLRQKDSDARCGLWVIDLRSGDVAHWVQLEGVVVELYDVVVIPNARRPMVLGFKTDEIQRLITIDTAPQPIFSALSVPDPASHAAESQTAPVAGAAGPGLPQVPEEAAAAARAAYERGNQRAKEGDVRGAVAHYEEALRLDPGHVKAHLNLGTVRHRLGEIEGAVACYRRAIEIDPRSVRGLTNLALVLQQQGETQEAIRHLEAALRVEPHNRKVLQQLGLLLSVASRGREARRCLEERVRLEPGSARAHADLGVALVNQQDHAAALPCFERAVRMDPGLYEGWLNMGICCETLGEVERAREPSAAPWPSSTCPIAHCAGNCSARRCGAAQKSLRTTAPTPRKYWRSSPEKTSSSPYRRFRGAVPRRPLPGRTRDATTQRSSASTRAFSRTAFRRRRR